MNIFSQYSPLDQNNPIMQDINITNEGSRPDKASGTQKIG